MSQNEINIKTNKDNNLNLKNLFKMRESILVVIILAQVIGLTIMSQHFLTYNNIVAVLFGCSLDAIIAIGMTYVIVCGDFDLSVGSTLALTGIAVAKLALLGVPPLFAFLIGGLILGALIGMINGLLVTKVGMNAFIATLAMMGIIRGIGFIITQGYPVTKLPKEFLFVGQNYLFKIPYTFYIMFILIIVGEFLFRKVRFFRQAYYVGGNITAAKYSGIKVDKVKIIMFSITGMLAGIAGTLQTSRLGSAMCTSGEGAELRIISSVIIGGAALSGGEGTVLGTFLGVILLALVVNGLILMDVSIYWQSVVSGLVLLVAVAFDIWAKKKRSA